MISVDGGLDNWWHVDFEITETKHYLNWTFNHSSVEEMSFHQAADYTANIIAQKYNNLHLLMSGGMDSEYVAETLYRNCIPFTPVIGFIPGSQNQDYFYAMNWCNQKNIEPLALEFELDDMRLQRSYAWVCKNTGITNDTFFTKQMIDVVIQRQGHVLLGETNLTSETRTSRWDEPVGDVFDITVHGLFGSVYATGHPAEFFAYTPELLLAMVSDVDTSVNNALAKSRLYNVPFRPKSWPFLSLTHDVKNKIKTICRTENLPTYVNQAWSKQELIGLLKKHK